MLGENAHGLQAGVQRDIMMWKDGGASDTTSAVTHSIAGAALGRTKAPLILWVRVLIKGITSSKRCPYQRDNLMLIPAVGHCRDACFGRSAHYLHECGQQYTFVHSSAVKKTNSCVVLACWSCFRAGHLGGREYTRIGKHEWMRPHTPVPLRMEFDGKKLLQKCII